MKPSIIFVALLSISCASWQVTPQAKARRSIAGKLKFCRSAETIGVNAKDPLKCECEAQARCVLAGFEESCAADEVYASCLGTETSGPPGSIPNWCVPPRQAKCELPQKEVTQL